MLVAGYENNLVHTAEETKAYLQAIAKFTNFFNLDSAAAEINRYAGWNIPQSELEITYIKTFVDTLSSDKYNYFLYVMGLASNTEVSKIEEKLQQWVSDTETYLEENPGASIFD